MAAGLNAPGNRVLPEMTEEPRVRAVLEYLPIGLFGSSMGLTGLSVAWRLAHERSTAPEWVADLFAVVAIITFIVVAIGYSVKLFNAPSAVAAEFTHPIAGNLFGTVLISLLLLPIVIAPKYLVIARGVWLIGAFGMVLFSWFVVTRWLSDRQQVQHATPAWIIPVVGLLDVPLAIPSLELIGLHQAMVFCLAVGLFFAVPLFTLILSRLLFETPMPEALQPSLLILVAPSAVGMSTYVLIVGTVDLFAQALYWLTVFLLAVLLQRLRHLVHCCPFRVSWWAVGFPLAASAISGQRYATAQPGAVADSLAHLMLGIATVAIVWLFGRTLYGVARGEMRSLSL